MAEVSGEHLLDKETELKVTMAIHGRDALH